MIEKYISLNCPLKNMSTIHLQDKIIIIIGGTTGIGLSAAKACLNAGAYVLTTGLYEESSNQAKQELGKNSLVLTSDAIQPQSAEQAIQTAIENWGTIDGLYHVAGGSGRRQGDGPLHEITDDGFQYTLDLNLKSLFYSNRAAVRYFLENEKGGSIVNVSSVIAYSPSPRYFATHAYPAAKAAIIGMTQSCASYYSTYNIRFNAIAPGMTITPMSQRAAGNETIMQYVKSKQPLDGGRAGSPSDMDAAAVYLLSDASRFMTGQVLTIDGGWSITDGQYQYSDQETP